jgi:hypothetical protein
MIVLIAARSFAISARRQALQWLPSGAQTEQNGWVQRGHLVTAAVSCVEHVVPDGGESRFTA